jgi:16S rRNA (adenine1518-N6/adenine1519-N6)-dimethyltransferase
MLSKCLNDVLRSKILSLQSRAGVARPISLSLAAYTSGARQRPPQPQSEAQPLNFRDRQRSKLQNDEPLKFTPVMDASQVVWKDVRTFRDTPSGVDELVSQGRGGQVPGPQQGSSQKEAGKKRQRGAERDRKTHDGARRRGGGEGGEGGRIKNEDVAWSSGTDQNMSTRAIGKPSKGRWNEEDDLREDLLQRGGPVELDRPFTLPPGQFKPKQSLGQNFLSDQNYVNKICDAFKDDSEGGSRVVEVGPGAGALSRVLYPRYPRMTCIELDQRAVAFLAEKLPGLRVVHQDVLTVNWAQLAADLGGPVRLIANLPYYIVSQVLFSLADAHEAIACAVVTMQLEVAERVAAKPNTKEYGIPSVVFQLYAQPHINFHIPPSVFYPRPAVDSALVTLDFTKPHKDLKRVRPEQFRKVITAAFQQRRKMLRVSLKDLIAAEGLTLPNKWAELRPGAISPVQFIHLVIDLYGEVSEREREEVQREKGLRGVAPATPADAASPAQTSAASVAVAAPVWRKNISPSFKANRLNALREADAETAAGLEKPGQEQGEK